MMGTVAVAVACVTEVVQSIVSCVKLLSSDKHGMVPLIVENNIEKMNWSTSLDIIMKLTIHSK